MSEFLNDARKEELWKGLKILFWGGIGICFVLVLRWFEVDLGPIMTALVSLATNAVVFTAYRFFKKKDVDYLDR